MTLKERIRQLNEIYTGQKPESLVVANELVKRLAIAEHFIVAGISNQERSDAMEACDLESVITI